MAKENKEERIFHCSGPKWEGDGSKATSACSFGDSMTAKNRYKCSHCLTGQTPANIHADADGVKAETAKAPENDASESLGKEIVEGLQELTNVVADGASLSEKFRVDEVGPRVNKPDELKSPKKTLPKKKKRRRF